MGGWRDGRCEEAGGEKLEECCKEQGQLAEASKEGLGSKWAVVPMMMMMMMIKNGVWVIHTNREFMNLCREPDIISEMRNRRLRWL
jgi:hypothetical protein